MEVLMLEVTAAAVAVDTGEGGVGGDAGRWVAELGAEGIAVVGRAITAGGLGTWRGTVTTEEEEAVAMAAVAEGGTVAMAVAAVATTVEITVILRGSVLTAPLVIVLGLMGVSSK